MKTYTNIFIINALNILRNLMFVSNGNLVTEPECNQEPPYVL
jgi:hypothetical protein